MGHESEWERTPYYLGANEQNVGPGGGGKTAFCRQIRIQSPRHGRTSDTGPPDDAIGPSEPETGRASTPPKKKSNNLRSLLPAPCDDGRNSIARITFLERSRFIFFSATPPRCATVKTRPCVRAPSTFGNTLVTSTPPSQPCTKYAHVRTEFIIIIIIRFRNARFACYYSNFFFFLSAPSIVFDEHAMRFFSVAGTDVFAYRKTSAL